MLIVRFARFLTHIFFSRVGVVHAERLPLDGAVIVVSNHHSALVDPMVLLATLQRPPRFMAKAALWQWKYLPIRPLLWLANAVPVHRVKDGGGDNSGMFKSTRQVLQQGGVVAVFGEGVSHNDPGLKDMRTGPARIALGASTDVAIVPVGLVFPDRPRYRSTVTVIVGEPIPVTGTAGGDEDREMVRQMTDRIALGLGAVAPTWEGQDDHDAAYAAGRVVAARHGVHVGEVVKRINRAVDHGDDAADAVLNASKDLLDECEHLDVDLDHVVEYKSSLGSLARSSHIRAAFWAIPTVVGHIANYPAYFTVDRIAKRNDFNFQATAKLLAGVVVYPVWWTVVFAWAWWRFSLPWALLAVAAAVLGGYVAGAKMKLLKTSNTRLIAVDNNTDLSGLEQRFNAVVAAVDRLPS